MSSKKFDEFDRARTIEVVEQRYGVRLSKVGAWQKYLVDEGGTPYVVLGGYEDWHGISKDIVVDVRKKPAGKLVVAKRLRSKIRVYCGPLSTLLANEHKLAINAAGERQFNLGWTAGHPHIKELRELSFEFVRDIPFTDEAKEKERSAKKVHKLLAALSPEQREAVLKTFKG